MAQGVRCPSDITLGIQPMIAARGVIGHRDGLACSLSDNPGPCDTSKGRTGSISAA